MPGLSRRELAGAAVRRIVVLTIRGKRYRFGETSLSITNSDPTEGPAVLQVLGGMDPLDVVDEVGLLTAGLQDRSVSVTLQLRGESDHTLSAAALGRRAWIGATAEVILHRVGDDWTRRQRLLRGRIDRPQYGSASEAVSFSVVAEAWEDGGLFPPDTWRVTSATWPRSSSSNVRIGESAEEEVYPVGFGEPGHLREGAAGTHDLVGGPALLVEVDDGGGGAEGTNTNQNAIYLLMGHRAAVSGVSGGVRLDNLTTGGSATFTPSTTQDELGQDCTIVTVSAAALPIDEGDEVWWSCTTNDKGGLTTLTDSTASMRGAGEIVRYLLGWLQGVPLDLARLDAVVPALDAFRLDFALNEQVSPWQFLTDQVFPLLPVSPVMGPDGLYLVLWRWDAHPEDATVILGTDERQGERAGPVQVSSSAEVYTAFHLDYGLDRGTGKYLKRAVAVPEATDDPYASVDPYCAAAARDLACADGLPVWRYAPTLSTDLVLDDATAQAILSWHVLEGTSVKEELTWTAPPEEQAAAPGAVAVVTDAGIGWTARVALVVAVTRGASQAALKLRTVPDRVADALE